MIYESIKWIFKWSESSNLSVEEFMTPGSSSKTCWLSVNDKLTSIDNPQRLLYFTITSNQQHHHHHLPKQHHHHHHHQKDTFYTRQLLHQTTFTPNTFCTKNVFLNILFAVQEQLSGLRLPQVTILSARTAAWGITKIHPMACISRSITSFQWHLPRQMRRIIPNLCWES